MWDPPLLCGRCTGFYLAILIALAVSALRPDHMRSWSSRAIGAGLVAFLAMCVEKAIDLELGNWGRFAAALPFGFAVGLGLAMPFIFQRSKEDFQ